MILDGSTGLSESDADLARDGVDGVLVAVDAVLVLPAPQLVGDPLPACWPLPCELLELW